MSSTNTRIPCPNCGVQMFDGYHAGFTVKCRRCSTWVELPARGATPPPPPPKPTPALVPSTPPKMGSPPKGETPIIPEVAESDEERVNFFLAPDQPSDDSDPASRNGALPTPPIPVSSAPAPTPPKPTRAPAPPPPKRNTTPVRPTAQPSSKPVQAPTTVGQLPVPREPLPIRVKVQIVLSLLCFGVAVAVFALLSPPLWVAIIGLGFGGILFLASAIDQARKHSTEQKSRAVAPKLAPAPAPRPGPQPQTEKPRPPIPSSTVPVPDDLPPIPVPIPTKPPPPAKTEFVTEPRPVETIEVDPPLIVNAPPKPDWQFAAIEDAEMLASRAQGEFEQVSGATATWQGKGKPPDEIWAEATLACPACRHEWTVQLTGVHVWLTNNAERVCVAGCPSCQECTLLVTANVPGGQSPTCVHFFATVEAAVPGRELAPPTICITWIGVDTGNLPVG